MNTKLAATMRNAALAVAGVFAVSAGSALAQGAPQSLINQSNQQFNPAPYAEAQRDNGPSDLALAYHWLFGGSAQGRRRRLEHLLALITRVATVKNGSPCTSGATNGANYKALSRFAAFACGEAHRFLRSPEQSACLLAALLVFGFRV